MLNCVAWLRWWRCILFCTLRWPSATWLTRIQIIVIIGYIGYLLESSLQTTTGHYHFSCYKMTKHSHKYSHKLQSILNDLFQYLPRLFDIFHLLSFIIYQFVKFFRPFSGKYSLILISIVTRSSSFHVVNIFFDNKSEYCTFYSTITNANNARSVDVPDTNARWRYQTMRHLLASIPLELL